MCREKAYSYWLFSLVKGSDSWPHPAYCTSHAGAEPVVMYSWRGHYHEHSWLLLGASRKPRVLSSREQLLGPLCGGRLPFPQNCSRHLWESCSWVHQLASNWESLGLRDPSSSSPSRFDTGSPVRCRSASFYWLSTIPDTGGHRPCCQTSQIGPEWQLVATEPAASGNGSPPCPGPGRFWLPLLVPQDLQSSMQVKPSSGTSHCQPAHQCHPAPFPGGVRLVPGHAGWSLLAGTEGADPLLGGRCPP